jgi:hypothetical protein
MTSHAYDAFADANLDPQPMDRQANAERDTAIATLRDIVRLTEENLPPTTVAARVQAIARACLSRLGVPVPVEVEDLGGGSGQCFPDDPPF